VGPEKGAYAPLMHRGRCVGAVMRTRAGVKPVFVSPGHLIDIRSARRVVLACLKGFRLPEPVRRAHILAGEEKRLLEDRSKRTV
jgi:deoxyribonuclease V